MTVLLGFEGRSAPAIRCDRCGKETPVPCGPFYDKCSGEAYKEYLAGRDASERGWLDEPALTDEHAVNEFNEELWSGSGPHPMFKELLEQMDFEANSVYKRTVCAECREAEARHLKDLDELSDLLVCNKAPVVWPWPEDDVPEPMPCQMGLETKESYMRRKAERKALKEQGKDPDRTPRYVLVCDMTPMGMGSWDIRNEPLSDDWDESVRMAEGFGPFREDAVVFIADRALMVRVPTNEWQNWDPARAYLLMITETLKKALDFPLFDLNAEWLKPENVPQDPVVYGGGDCGYYNSILLSKLTAADMMQKLDSDLTMAELDELREGDDDTEGRQTEGDKDKEE